MEGVEGVDVDGAGGQERERLGGEKAELEV